LVIFQFAISILLFISATIVYSQLQYIQNKRLGFSKENVLVIKRGWAIGQNPDGTLQETAPNTTVIDAFKNDLLKHSQIISVAGTQSLPGKDYYDFILLPEGGTQDEQLNFNYFSADYDFVKTLKLELVEGRFFSRDMISDTIAVVINEAAAKSLGYEKPIVGKHIMFSGSDFRLNIIGVVKDFHYESLHRKVKPIVIGLDNLYRTYLAVRIQPHNVPETIEIIKNTWDEYIPYKPFEYFFFDEDYDNLYRAEQRTGKLFIIFSVLALFLACLGLFGLASYTTELKTKEIGIRKVLGASISNIVARLSKEFSKWVLIANVIAWPIAYLFVNNWLQDFAYKIDITLWPFIISGLLALLIAIVTVSFQTIKSALANPVDSLRNE
ncbi:MAG: ABC transporter permease, partial [Ignavibacteria bacterium]|jgi:putative ABC transport system permease protein